MSNFGDARDTQKIINVDLNKEVRQAFLDYSMSVITSRALPDVRDGLKPVHRRILYTMHENGLTPDKAYRKCADTVGSVLGRYHPHGDASVYDAMVRLAQTFSMRYILVDGHGNFGSVDGDPPAAYRYTESRMSKMALRMLTDIDKDTVDFTTNYDANIQIIAINTADYLLIRIRTTASTITIIRIITRHHAIYIHEYTGSTWHTNCVRAAHAYQAHSNRKDCLFHVVNRF